MVAPHTTRTSTLSFLISREGLTLQTGKRDDTRIMIAAMNRLAAVGWRANRAIIAHPRGGQHLCLHGSSGTASSNMPGTAGIRSPTTRRSPAFTPGNDAQRVPG